MLVMRPKSFFSNKFEIYVEQEEVEKPRQAGSERLVDLTLILMILLIGVPVLVYCIISSSI